jgi:hypothetical protein
MRRPTTTSLLTVIAITSSVVILFARAFGYSGQDSPAERPTPSAQSPASEAEHDCDLNLVGETVASLRGFHVDSTDAGIPVSARPLLITLKHELRDLISNRLRSEGREVSTQQVQASVIVDLKHSGVIVTEPACVIIDADFVDTGYEYGDIYDITIKRPHDCFDLIAVTTTLGVLCGQDSSLYLFKYEDRNWKLILASEASDYDLISGAQGGFDFGVSFPDQNGEFFVVTTSVNPWCTSNWQAITYRVLRPGTSAYQPRELFKRKKVIWLIDDPPYRLEVRGTGFTLSFHDEEYLEMHNRGEEIDADDPKSMKIMKYSVDGDSVRRKNRNGNLIAESSAY